MKRNTLNYMVDIPLLVQSFIVSVTGVVLMFGNHGTSFLGFNSRELLHMHELIGLLMVAFSVIHLVLHWKWMACTTKNLVTGKSVLTSKCEAAYPVED
ncbi:DUF4405 domain-containing protein [Methanolobus bombayensis]|uniref:DUF4405 domain-containing protein n=1 Tax=Methanolobus bombayensis TaxID=38023 RepID=UPI001AEA000F|nr:DUF4405 domain-containing protein [Methanolobus bombayensis]MBP1909097.1 cytochrome b subunit of formate dehydrogenase [Methanolobus bombayensis]